MSVYDIFSRRQVDVVEEPPLSDDDVGEFMSAASDLTDAGDDPALQRAAMRRLKMMVKGW